MAVRQANSIGIANTSFEYVYPCAILRNDLVDSAFYSSTSNPIYWNDNASSTAGNDCFTDLGLDINVRINENHYYQYSPSGAMPGKFYVYLACIDNKFLCIDTINPPRGNSTWDFNFCITDQPIPKVTKLENLNSDVQLFRRLDRPFRFAVLFDDDLRQMQFVVQAFTKGSTCHCYGAFNEAERKNAYNLLRDFIDIPSSDPWIDAGESTIGGGDGNFDISTDSIVLGNYPVSVVNTGFLQIFSPNLKQIAQLADYMWSDSFVSNLIRVWDNPMDIILGLMQYPLVIPSSTSRNVSAGNIDTPVIMAVPDSQYITLDCGDLVVNKFYDSYLDFEPYTNCAIYLPYIGNHKLSLDDISGKTINVKYSVDIITGSCVANIYVNGSIMYSFTGMCGVNIPVTSQSYSNVIQNAVNVASSIVSHPTVGGVVSNVAGAVMSAKPVTERTGQLSGNIGLLSPQKPYLTFSIPRVCLPKNQNTFIGYPSYIEIKLGQLSGFTRVSDVKLSGIDCTIDELKMIEELLKEGVIV